MTGREIEEKSEKVIDTWVRLFYLCETNIHNFDNLINGNYPRLHSIQNINLGNVLRGRYASFNSKGWGVQLHSYQI